MAVSPTDNPLWAHLLDGTVYIVTILVQVMLSWQHTGQEEVSKWPADESQLSLEAKVLGKLQLPIKNKNKKKISQIS